MKGDRVWFLEICLAAFFLWLIGKGVFTGQTYIVGASFLTKTDYKSEPFVFSSYMLIYSGIFCVLAWSLIILRH